VENLDYAAFAIRIIRAHGRRIAQGDIEAPPDLLDLAEQLAADRCAEKLRLLAACRPGRGRRHPPQARPEFADRDRHPGIVACIQPRG
jgi:hypothetical protein